MAFFVGNKHRRPFRNRKHVLVPSPGITACSLGPRVDTCRINRTLIGRVGSSGCSTVVLGFTGPSVMNRSNVLRPAVGTVRTISRGLNTIISTVRTGNNCTVVFTSRNGTSAVSARSKRPRATRAAMPIPIVMAGRNIALHASNGLTSITPAVLSLLGMRGPTRVANRSLVIGTWTGHFDCYVGWRGYLG